MINTGLNRSVRLSTGLNRSVRQGPLLNRGSFSQVVHSDTVFEGLKQDRINNASEIVTVQHELQDKDVFFSNALRKTEKRLCDAKPNNNQQLVDRLERRITNLEKIFNILKSDQYQFLGAMGWGNDCIFQTRCGGGSSEIDSIYFKDESGNIQFIQLDSCLEAQQLGWLYNASPNTPGGFQVPCDKCLFDQGRLFSSEGNQWNDSSKITYMYKTKKRHSFSTLNTHSDSLSNQSAESLRGCMHSSSCRCTERVCIASLNQRMPTGYALESFQYIMDAYQGIIDDLSNGVKHQIRDGFTKMREEFFGKPDSAGDPHRQKVERIFNTREVNRSNGISWEMPGDGTAVKIGQSFSMSSGQTIDEWVKAAFGFDHESGKNDEIEDILYDTKPKADQVANRTKFLESGIMPLHQVTGVDATRLKVFGVLINIVSGYSLVDYDKDIKLTDNVETDKKIAGYLLEKLILNFDPRKLNEFVTGDFWINGLYEASSQIGLVDMFGSNEAYYKVLGKILKQVHAFTVFNNHTGLCCPTCKEGDEGGDVCPLGTGEIPSAIEYKDPSPSTLPDLSIRSVHFDPHLVHPTVDDVVTNLGKIFTSIQTKIDKLDFAGLISYRQQLTNYGVNDAFKTAMMMKYIMAILDTIWVYDQSEPTSVANVDSSLSGRLGPEIKALQQLLFSLTDALVHNPNIPDDVSEENWRQQDIVESNYKARFAIAETVSGALELLKDGPIEEEKVAEEDEPFSQKGLSDLERNAQANVFLKAKLNRDITDENTYLENYRHLNDEPKINPMDVKVSLGERLGHLLRPVALNMVAGKLGVGKSQFLKSSFDLEAQKTIQSKHVYKLDNIEKQSSDFDSKHSQPKTQVLLTINKDKLDALRLQFPNLTDAKPSTEDDPEDAAKLVGCACCSGRGLTQAAIEAVDRGKKSIESEAIVLDSIGYADFKGMATISHEAVMGRVFFNHAVTLVNLNNPAWAEIFQAVRDYSGPEGTFAKHAEKQFEGTFTNVLVQQLVHATHVLINNHGDGRNGITASQLEDILNAIGQEQSVVIDGFNALKPNPNIGEEGQRHSQLLSHFTSELNQGEAEDALRPNQIQPCSIPQEVDIFHSELDESYTQVDLDTSALTDENMAAFLEEIKKGYVDRAKGHYLNKDKRWVEYQITDAANFYYNVATH